ncbi:MAG: major capsid family protein [Xenococcus sp. (in: cyanobacteria)]
MSSKLGTPRTDADIQNAGSYLSRQLEQRIGKVYEKKYAPLWAEAGRFLTATPDLDPGATSIIEEIIEAVGKAEELSDMSDDVPLVAISEDENRFKVHCFVLAYKYTITQLHRARKTGDDISLRRAAVVDRILREQVHNVAVFGDKKRGSQGFFNNDQVPVSSTGYNPNTASFQDHLDFVGERLAKVRKRNHQTEDVSLILVSDDLKFLWNRTRNANGTTTVSRALMEDYGVANNGTLTGIYSVNECSAEELEAFGVRPSGTDEDRVIFVPESEDVAERHYFPCDYLPPQLRDMSYKVCAYHGTSETIIHYPEAMEYSDIPKVTT